MSISLAHKQMFEMRGRPTKKPASFRASQRASTGAFLEARLSLQTYERKEMRLHISRTARKWRARQGLKCRPKENGRGVVRVVTLGYLFIQNAKSSRIILSG